MRMPFHRIELTETFRTAVECWMLISDYYYYWSYVVDVLWHTISAALELFLLTRLTSLARWRWSRCTSNPVAVVLDWVCRFKSVVVKSCHRSPVRLVCSLARMPALRASRHPFCAAPALGVSIYTRCLHPWALAAGFHCCGWTKLTALNLSQITIPTH